MSVKSYRCKPNYNKKCTVTWISSPQVIPCSQIKFGNKEKTDWKSVLLFLGYIKFVYHFDMKIYKKYMDLEVKMYVKSMFSEEKK